MDNTIMNVLKKWWIVLILGIISLVLGFVLLFNPGTGFEIAKTVVIADYLILAAAAIAVVVARRDEIPAWGWELCGAVALFVLGIIAAATPGASESITIALFIMGFLIEGISGIYGSLMLKKLSVPGWGWSMLFAVITVVLGIMLIANPIAAALSIDILVAAAMLSFGISLVIISYKLSKINGSLNVALKQAGEKARAVIEAAEQAVEYAEQVAAEKAAAEKAAENAEAENSENK